MATRSHCSCAAARRRSTYRWRSAKRKSGRGEEIGVRVAIRLPNSHPDPELVLRRRNHDLDAAVELAPDRRVVRRDGELRAVAARVDALGLDAAGDQRFLDGVGTLLRQTLVQLLRAGAVGEALDGDTAVAVLGEQPGDVVERALRAVLERRLAGVKQQLVLHRQHPAALGLLGLDLGELVLQTLYFSRQLALLGVFLQALLLGNAGAVFGLEPRRFDLLLGLLLGCELGGLRLARLLARRGDLAVA